MAGMRLGGTAVVVTCSPPFGAFEGTDGDGDANVYRACSSDVAGLASEITDFNDGAVTSEGIHNPVLSPDGTKILFELANPSTGFTEIWVVNRTPGSTATQLIADASNYVMHPFWHPDSDQFVYVHGASGSLLGSIKKASVAAPGTVTTLKTKDATNSPFRPQFSPDGAQVAYLWDQNVGGTGHLRIMDADGSNDSALDTAVRYRFQGPQFAWSHDGTLIAYDDGANSPNAAYVIAPDGTGKTQINSAGDAAGVGVRVSDRAWPDDDSYVILAATAGLFTGQAPTRCELDGSGSTYLNALHGSSNSDYFRQVLVVDGRIWFIETSNQMVSSVAIDGSDYTVHLTIDGGAMSDMGSGDGWFYN